MHFLNGPNKADIYLPKLGTIFPSNFVPTHVDSPHGVVRRDGGTPEIRFHQPFQLLPPSTLLTKFRSSFSPTISILLGESLTLVLINVRDDETIESKCWSKIVLNSFANFATFMLMKRKEQVLRGLLSDQYFRFPI